MNINDLVNFLNSEEGVTTIEQGARGLAATKAKPVEGLKACIPFAGSTAWARRFGCELDVFANTYDEIDTLVEDKIKDEAAQYPVLENSIEETFGTIFSPAQYLVIDGEKIAGPMFHGSIDIQELYVGDDSRGMFYVLDNYAMGVMLFSLGRYNINDLRELAAARTCQMVGREICNRRAGIQMTARLMYDRRAKNYELFVSKSLAEKFVAQLSKWLRRKVTVETVGGLKMILSRSPVTDNDCVPTVTVYVVESDIDAVWCNDVTAKALGGDFDGDPVAFTLSQHQSRESARKQMGCPIIEANPDPQDFGTLTWSVKEARNHQFQTGQQLAVGLAVKTLFQGLITNYFSRIAGCAVILAGRDEIFFKATELRLKNRGYIVIPGDVQSMVASLMDCIKRNETIMTEVIMDFRKYVFGSEEGKAKQFADEMFAIAKAAGRATISGPLLPSLANVEKGDKKFDLESVDSVMVNLGILRPADFLAKYPLQNCLVGGPVVGTEAGSIAVAQCISEMGMDTALLAFSGLVIEDAVEVKTPDKKENKATPKPSVPRPDFTQYENPWDYVVDYIAMLDPTPRMYKKLDRGMLFRMPDGRDVTLPWVLSVKRSGRIGVASFVVVETAKGSKRYSRLQIRPVVRNLTSVKDDYSVEGLVRSYGVEVVSFLDLIAEMIVKLRLDIDKALQDSTKEGAKPYNGLVWEEKALTAKKALLDQECRLPGQSNKGDEIVHGRIEVHSMQVSIEVIQTANAVENYHALVAMGEMVDYKEGRKPLIDPLSGLELRPFVGCTSKSNPMSMAFLLEEGKTMPAHILAVNQFVGNRDRINRESATVLQGRDLINPIQVIWNSKKIGDLANKRRDSVVAMISGIHNQILMTKQTLNGDQMLVTPTGRINLMPTPMKRVVTGLSSDELDAFAIEELGVGANYAQLENSGYEISIVHTPLPGRSGQKRERLDMVSFDVVCPDYKKDKSPLKLWMSGGNKALAAQTRNNYHVIIDGEKVAIDAMVSQETMVGFQNGSKWDGGKKQDLTVLAGILSLLGKHDWTGIEELELESLKTEVAFALDAMGMPESGCIPMYNDNGDVVGECVAMLLPVYVCTEPNIAKVKANGFARGINISRLLGETITLRDNVKSRIQSMADMAMGKSPKGDLLPARDARYYVKEEYTDLYNWMEDINIYKALEDMGQLVLAFGPA